MVFSNKKYPLQGILLRLAWRDYGGQVAPAYAKAPAGKHSAWRIA